MSPDKISELEVIKPRLAPYFSKQGILKIMQVELSEYRTLCLAQIKEKTRKVFLFGGTKFLPRAVHFPEKVLVTKVGCSSEHCGAISSLGTVYTWGNGSGGKLGHDDFRDQSTPTRIESCLVSPATEDMEANYLNLTESAVVALDFAFGCFHSCFIFSIWLWRHE